MRALGLLLVLLASPVWSLTFGTGCADPCGQELVVRGQTATCTVFVANDGGADEDILVEDAHYVVHHGDGDETVPAGNTGVTLKPGEQGLFPAEVGAHPIDDQVSMAAVGDLVIIYPDGTRIPTEEQFADHLAIVDQSTCVCSNSATTTTLAELTTTTTSSTVATCPEITTTTLDPRCIRRHRRACRVS